MKIEELRVGSILTYNGVNVKAEVINNEIGEVYVWGDDFYYNVELENLKPIPLTEEWLLKFGFKNWGEGSLYSNEYESYTRYVLHNVIDGTSNFEVHFINSRYGGLNHFQYVISCDEDERINFGSEMEYLHQLQNLYLALTGHELCEAK